MRVKLRSEISRSRYLMNLLSGGGPELGTKPPEDGDADPPLSEPEAPGGAVDGGGLHSFEQTFPHDETRGEAPGLAKQLFRALASRARAPRLAGLRRRLR